MPARTHRQLGRPLYPWFADSVRVATKPEHKERMYGHYALEMIHLPSAGREIKGGCGLCQRVHTGRYMALCTLGLQTP